MSGPMRVAWTFPKRGADLILALEEKQKQLVQEMGEKLSAELAWERDVKKYREALREVGVANWEHAIPDNSRDLSGRLKTQQIITKRELDEVLLYKAALIDDQKLNPHRLYKLSPVDLQWFGLDGSY